MIHFYTLLYINKEEASVGNSIKGNYFQKMQKYVLCCSLLSRSLEANGLSKLNVITNNASLVRKFCNDLNCIEISFNTKIPNDVAFSGAHCKLDVFKYFASLKNSEYSILLDTDVVCIARRPKLLQQIASKGLPLFYNISSQQISAFTAEKVCKDKELLIRNAFNDNDFVSSALWAGGEFIGGNASFFKTLSLCCTKILPLYLLHLKKLFHNGDEMIVSCALEYLIQNKKVFAFDAGELLLVARYYDSNTNHVQHIWKFIKQCFLLHLPMDKDFLAASENDYRNSDDFMLKLEQHLKKNKTFIDATVRADCTLQKLTSCYYKLRAFIKKITGHGNAPVEY